VFFFFFPQPCDFFTLSPRRALQNTCPEQRGFSVQPFCRHGRSCARPGWFHFWFSGFYYLTCCWLFRFLVHLRAYFLQDPFQGVGASLTIWKRGLQSSRFFRSSPGGGLWSKLHASFVFLFHVLPPQVFFLKPSSRLVSTGVFTFSCKGPGTDRHPLTPWPFLPPPSLVKAFNPFLLSPHPNPQVFRCPSQTATLLNTCPASLLRL